MRYHFGLNIPCVALPRLVDSSTSITVSVSPMSLTHTVATSLSSETTKVSIAKLMLTPVNIKYSVEYYHKLSRH